MWPKATEKLTPRGSEWARGKPNANHVPEGGRPSLPPVAWLPGLQHVVQVIVRAYSCVAAAAETSAPPAALVGGMTQELRHVVISLEQFGFLLLCQVVEVGRSGKFPNL